MSICKCDKCGHGIPEGAIRRVLPDGFILCGPCFRGPAADVPPSQQDQESITMFPPGRACPKCGNLRGNVRTRWVPGGPGSTGYLRRECIRCKYDWKELPLDSDAGEYRYKQDATIAEAKKLE